MTLPTALLILSLFVGASGSKTKSDRKVVIRNESGRRIEVNWVHPSTKARHLMSEPDVLTGAEFNLNSFVSHEFEMKELPARRTGQCTTPNKCQVTFWAVNEHDMQVITINGDFEIEHDDHTTKARKQAEAALADCKKMGESLRQTSSAEDLLNAVIACITDHVTDRLDAASDDIAFSASTRRKMADYYENYTCADLELETSPAIENQTWVDPRNMQKRLKVSVLLARPSARIHLIENFISEDECQTLQKHAEPRLSRALVADGQGGFEVSEHRKAKQASIRVPWYLEEAGNEMPRLSRRVYDYANHVLGMGIEEHGQEDLISIQYKGLGRDSNSTEEPDQYRPHCDGDCTGDDHKHGTRVATMIMYCTVPDLGGATNFRNAGIHVNGRSGDAVFFSYIDPETGKMDSGLTEHSGCPVIEGDKKIVTQWLRQGVTSEVPWSSYNSLGIRNEKFDIQVNEKGELEGELDKETLERVLAPILALSKTHD